jgi:hypothetical protein
MEFFADDCSLDMPRGPDPWGKRFTGKAAVREGLAIRGWPVAVSLAWFWVAIEIINGIVHPLWSLREGGYTPGLATAPILLLLAVYLAHQLRRAAHEPSTAA